MIMCTQLFSQQLFVLNSCLGMLEVPPKRIPVAFGTVVLGEVHLQKLYMKVFKIGVPPNILFDWDFPLVHHPSWGTHGYQKTPDDGLRIASQNLPEVVEHLQEPTILLYLAGNPVFPVDVHSSLHQLK